MADLTNVEKEELNEKLKKALEESRFIRTDNNAPIENGYTWYTCPAEYWVLLKKLRENPTYFKDMNIVAVEVLSNEEYNRMIRKKYAIDEMSYEYIKDKLPTGEEVVKLMEAAKQVYYDHVKGEIVAPTTIIRDMEKPTGKITIHSK